MKNFDLNGKVVLITGASGGIGQAVTNRLYERGANLVLTDISAEGLNRTFAELNKERVILAPLDVTNMAGTKEVVLQAVNHFGRLDMVMANAGVGAKVPSTLLTIDVDEFTKVINVDLFGVWNTVKASLPHIIDAKGHVLITASVYAFINGVANAPYAMSKAAVEQMGRALRTELGGTGATAGVLYPGWVDTNIAKVAFGEHDVATKLVQHAMPGPFGRRVKPDEIALAVIAGVERRAPRIIAPKYWAPISWFRGVVNIFSDAMLEKDAKFQMLIRELERKQ
ncbi:SDR family NAD(P)-dependent oxidoreductase [Undibacterium sp. SXout7W]|uniref:SDR family NAD(P)-dependent oxidoreductase n=1 Tax=Undibacterium sp. SXout7W TaxID=3413049 RepID=UPI003BEF7D50